jgi:hypothetical protein
MTKRTGHDPILTLSSPACSMREADDAYMGYAGKEELLAFLNELLEAKRAGAWIALQSAGTTETGPITELMQTIRRDEARWCAMLLHHIEALGGTPSTKTGVFYDKAMAGADLGTRITFLNRNQASVVRKLREKLPRLRDDRLHADLHEMLRSHEANIARASEVAACPERGGQP